jgi:hypothetical protein
MQHGATRAKSRAELLTEIDAPSFKHSQPEIISAAELAELRASSQPPSAASSRPPSQSPRELSDFELPSTDESANDNALIVSLAALADSAALPDSDAAALHASERASERAPATPSRPAEPNLSTRAASHVDKDVWFDTTLEIPGVGGHTVDLRQQLTWRFKAAFAAYKLLVPMRESADRRAELVTLLRDYERMLRSVGTVAPGSPKQVTDVLHSLLSMTQAKSLEQLLSELERKLLAIDESLSVDAFRSRWNKQHAEPKALLRYARFLASQRFDIGYRRDRFETLATELLTANLPSGAMLLMPRARAAPVLVQLLRGLPRAALSSSERAASMTYLRDALDRLDSLSGPKQFFESGFFSDVYGYKISMYDRITNPEFLYLCVAINVEVHNRLRSFGKTSKDASKPGSQTPQTALLARIREQQESVQAVFPDFRKPGVIARKSSRAPATKKQTSSRAPKTQRRAAAPPASSLVRMIAASLFLLVVVGANLYVTGVVTLHPAPQALKTVELQALSPLLLTGSVNAAGTHFAGLLSRPLWQRLDARSRVAAAGQLAQRLVKRGVQHAEVLAYKARAIEIKFGTVTYVDAAN